MFSLKYTWEHEYIAAILEEDNAQFPIAFLPPNSL